MTPENNKPYINPHQQKMSRRGFLRWTPAVAFGLAMGLGNRPTEAAETESELTAQQEILLRLSTATIRNLPSFEPQLTRRQTWGKFFEALNAKYNTEFTQDQILARWEAIRKDREHPTHLQDFIRHINLIYKGAVRLEHKSAKKPPIIPIIDEDLRLDENNYPFRDLRPRFVWKAWEGDAADRSPQSPVLFKTKVLFVWVDQRNDNDALQLYESLIQWPGEQAAILEFWDEDKDKWGPDAYSITIITDDAGKSARKLYVNGECLDNPKQKSPVALVEADLGSVSYGVWKIPR